MKHQGGVVARRCGLRGQRGYADRHRGNQSQHASSADHRLLGDDDAPTVRRALHVGPRPRDRTHLQGVRCAAGDDGADGGLRAGHAPPWHGELILGHKGPIGSDDLLYLDPDSDEDIRLAIVAFGPQTLALGGREFGDVVLHTYFTPETLRRCVRTVKEAAEQAGRDPDSVRVWSCLATVSDHLPEATRLPKTVGRLATCLQGYCDLLVRTDDWDPAVHRRFREGEVVRFVPGGIDHRATSGQIEHIADLIPDEWLEAAATGTPQRCAERIRRERALGADAVIMLGATPAELAPVVEAHRAIGH